MAPALRLSLDAKTRLQEGGGRTVRALSGPSLRLSHVVGAQGDNNLLGQRGVAQLPEDRAPALLISFAYLAPFLKNQTRYRYRDWALDSGAFTAHASGKAVDLKAYVETCLRLLETDPTLAEVYSLDVIGDWKASIRNTEALWAAGVPAIPCYHVGEPEAVLLGLAQEYPKIALGGAVGYRHKLEWAKQCFARIWPKKVHGFGYGSKTDILALPWHSVDATNWEIGPCKFGRWAAFGRLDVRGSKQNLRAEVEYYLDVEREAALRWRKEMALLEAQAPSLRFALGFKPTAGQMTAFAKTTPAVRLATANSSGEAHRKYVKAFGRKEQPR